MRYKMYEWEICILKVHSDKIFLRKYGIRSWAACSMECHLARVIARFSHKQNKNKKQSKALHDSNKCVYSIHCILYIENTHTIYILSAKNWHAVLLIQYRFLLIFLCFVMYNMHMTQCLSRTPGLFLYLFYLVPPRKAFVYFYFLLFWFHIQLIK